LEPRAGGEDSTGVSPGSGEDGGLLGAVVDDAGGDGVVVD
jgi:hypothetical protein